MDPVYPWTWWRMATTRPRVLKLIMRREASTWIEQNFTECNNHLCWIQFMDVPCCCCTGENQFHIFPYLSISSQMNTMTTISNDFPSSRSTDNLNYQKVLLTAAATPTTVETTTATTVTQQQQQQQHNINITTDTAHQLDTGTDKSSSNKMFNKMLLMSPILGPVATTTSVCPEKQLFCIIYCIVNFPPSDISPTT